MQVLQALTATADELNATQAQYEHLRQLLSSSPAVMQGSMDARAAAVASMLSGNYVPRDVPHLPLVVEDEVEVRWEGGQCCVMSMFQETPCTCH